MMDLIIRKGLLVNADATIQAEVAIKDGKIYALGAWGSFDRGKKEIDAEGKLVIPGLVDPHTHIAHPYRAGVSQDDFYTATVSAAHGGTTTLIDFAIQWDKNRTLLDSIGLRRSQTDGQAVIDYALHACPTLSNEETLKAVPEVIRQGIPSFKIYMIYRKQGRMVDDAILYGMLGEAKRHGGIVGVHAENSAIAEFNEEVHLSRGLKGAQYFPLVKPNLVEAECIHRALYLNRWANGRLYIFHLSTREGLEMVMEARAKGESVTAETCTHYLTLTEDVYNRQDGADFICSPPLRSKADMEALWQGVANGAISVIGSDHCGFGREQKAIGGGDFSQTPNGLPGIEVRLPMIYTEGVLKGRMTVNRMVEVLSTNPAKVFGLFPQKGALLPGSDADLVVLETSQERIIKYDQLHGGVDWTPYEGMKVYGFPYATLSRGEVIIEGGRFCGNKGRGKFIERRLG